MRTLFKTFLICGLIGFSSAQAQELPVPSPYGEVMQRIGLTDVKVEYSRPGVKGRQIFGDLLSFGNIWRTGANAATKIHFSTDVKIGGQKLKAGSYSVLSVPDEDVWKVMINNDLQVTEGSYAEENNVLVLEVEATKTDKMVETLTFTFDEVKENVAMLTFQWANFSWSIPIEVSADEQAMKNIEAKINEVESAYGVYNTSARYYLEHEKDLDQALAWSKKSVEIEAKFWNVYTLSRIYGAKGDYKNAIKTAKQSLELAKAANYMPYVKMNEENIANWSKK